MLRWRRKPILSPELLTVLRLHVELIHDPGCPHVQGAREALSYALRTAGTPAVWTEWRTDDAACPGDRRGYGSPTILVNGADVAPGPHEWKMPEEGAGPRCRVYETADGLVGVPPLQAIQAALEAILGPDVV